MVTNEELADALQDAIGWTNRGRFLWPYSVALPPDPSAVFLLMEWGLEFELRRLQVSYSRVIAGAPVQDAAMTTHHFLNLTDGLPDASWITADYTAVEAAFDTFWGAIKNQYAAQTVLSEYEWRADGPAFRPFGAALSPTLRRVARAVAGSEGAGGKPLPPQTAMSVTETTAAKFTVEDVEGVGTQVRNRWGRFYLPAMTSNALLNGRWQAAVCDQVSAAAKALYDTCTAAGLVPVMYSPTTGHAWSVLELHVDDITDVIRSRRFVEPLTRSPRVIVQP